MHSNESEQKPRARLTKATASMATLQPLEITTTAVVTPEEVPVSPSIVAKEHEDPRLEMRRKQSHHRHHVKSPVFTPDNPVSPLLPPSPSHADSVSFPILPPPAWTTNPIYDGSGSSNKGVPSEAIVALHDAVNVTPPPTDGVAKKSPGGGNGGGGGGGGGGGCTTRQLDQLFESSFFSAVILLQWSNVVGPKLEKIWSSDEAILKDDKLQALIGRQVLNGEMGRSLSTVELKWIALHRQAILCASFLYNDDTIDSLCALVFVLPVRYLRNFSPYFDMVKDHVPLMLVQPLQQLRRIHKRKNLRWEVVLEFFANRRLAPFIHSIMKVESVSLPCGKISYSLLDQESRQLFDTPFFAKLVTSHLQTFGSTVLTGNSLTTINAMINTLSLFLSSEDRNRSSHARKNMKYIPDLYLQGLLAQDTEDMTCRVLESNVPTTLVDMTRLHVKQTPLFPTYRKLQKEYRDWYAMRLEEELQGFMQSAEKSPIEWRRQSSLFRRVDTVAPMVQTLLDDIWNIPVRLREAYVQQWRRWLVRRAVAFIKFVKEESADFALVKEALALNDPADLLIVIAQAEKLKPGIVHLLDVPLSSDGV